MKKIIRVILLILISTLLIVSCGKSPEEKAKDALQEAFSSVFGTRETKTSLAPIEAIFGEEINLGKYKVTFTKTGSAIVNQGKQITHIYFDFTNESGDTINAGQALRISGYQNGVELKRVSMIDDTGEHDRDSKNVRTGSTIKDVRQSFFLDSDTNILIEVSEYVMFGDQPQKYEVNVPIE